MSSLKKSILQEIKKILSEGQLVSVIPPAHIQYIQKLHQLLLKHDLKSNTIPQTAQQAITEFTNAVKNSEDSNVVYDQWFENTYLDGSREKAFNYIRNSIGDIPENFTFVGSPGDPTKKTGYVGGGSGGKGAGKGGEGFKDAGKGGGGMGGGTAPPTLHRGGCKNPKYIGFNGVTSGIDVKTVQTALTLFFSTRGAAKIITFKDDNFSETMESLVKEFQRAKKLKDDGCVGPRTACQLMKLYNWNTSILGLDKAKCYKLTSAAPKPPRPEDQGPPDQKMDLLRIVDKEYRMQLRDKTNNPKGLSGSILDTYNGNSSFKKLIDDAFEQGKLTKQFIKSEWNKIAPESELPKAMEESKNWLDRTREDTTSNLFERLVKDASKKVI